MLHASCTLFVMVLFFLLTPGILLSLPQSGSLQQKALVHAVVFGVIFHFFHSVMIRYSMVM
jgi:hypothetical protein